MTLERPVTDDLDALLRSLPPYLDQRVRALDSLEGLLEIVMDLGRLPEARFADREEDLTDREVTPEDIGYVMSRIGQFGGDNRAGIERTLHRISALRNRAGKVVGLTLRVGRAVYGTVDIIREVIESGKSVLLVGKPGVGKTTLLRDAARVLADEPASAWSSWTPPTRSPATATSRIRASAARGGCRCRHRRCSTP